MYKEIISAAAGASGIPARAISGPRRIQRFCDARAIAAFEMLRIGMSLSAVGRALRRHHTTIINSRRTYLALYDTCPEFRAKADACREAVEGIAANQKNEAA